MRKSLITTAVLICAAVFSGCTSLSAGAAGNTADHRADYFGDPDGDRAAIVLDCVLRKEKAVVREEGVFIPLSFVWNEFDPGFYYEEAGGTVCYTLEDEEHSWSEGDGSGSVMTIEGEPYILADCLKEYGSGGVNVFDDPARVVLTTEDACPGTAKVTKDTELYLNSGNRGGVLCALSEGEEVFYLSDENGYAYIGTPDGYAGYVEDGFVTDIQEPADTSAAYADGGFTKLTFDGTVRMVWDFIEYTDDNAYLEEMLAKAEGVNVISPTWYALSDTSGNITSLSGREYVERAHAMGMQVWPMLSDLDKSAGSTGAALYTRESREKIITALMAEADECGFDGINIDLELITEQSVPDFLQFLRELTAQAHGRDLIVSVNNYVPTFTGFYNRSAQIGICDYLIVMAYDEHTASSDEIGSAASLPFVRKGVEDTLKEVPAGRLILGVPFYSRAWTQNFGEEGFDTQALGMEGAEKFIKDHGIDKYLYWDNDAGQNYGTATDETARYTIWQEDADSLRKKIELVNAYGLAGAAAWRLGYETDDVWMTWAEILGK